MTDTPKDVGPLGMGHKPVKDPIKGFNGMVISSTLTLEALTLVLALPMLRMLYSGDLWTGVNIAIVVALMVFHLVMLAFASRRWSLNVILAVQVLGIIAGLFIHWSIVAIMVVFGLVWLLAAYLRSNLIARMERGLLTTQHLDQKS